MKSHLALLFTSTTDPFYANASARHEESGRAHTGECSGTGHIEKNGKGCRPFGGLPKV